MTGIDRNCCSSIGQGKFPFINISITVEEIALTIFSRNIANFYAAGTGIAIFINKS